MTVINIEEIVAEHAAIPDRETRVRAVNRTISTLETLGARLAAMRHADLYALVNGPDDLTQVEAARRTGMTPARVSQILNPPPPARRSPKR